MQQPTYGNQGGGGFAFGPQLAAPAYQPGAAVQQLGYWQYNDGQRNPGIPGSGSQWIPTGQQVTPYWDPNQQASQRFVAGDDGGQRALGVRQTYGILDQARYNNALSQQRTEQALFAAGAAQMQGFDRAMAEAERYGAAGYQEAADLEQRLLSETKGSLAGSGLYNSTLQTQASQFALERGMRARLDVDRSLSDMYQRLHIGRAGAEAQTYQQLGNFYEQARSTNEQSLMAEFNQRMGIAGYGQQREDDSSSGWSDIASAVGMVYAFTGW